MKKMLTAAVLAASLILPAAARAAPDSIKIATEGAYEPWNFTAAGGKLDGFEVDLANDLCARMKIRCEIVAQDWDGLIPSLKLGKFDAIMASMLITPKRLEVIQFSRPYATGATSFVVGRTGPQAKLPGLGSTLDLSGDPATVARTIDAMKTALKGSIVGVQVGTANAAFLDKYFKGVVEVREYKTTEQHDLDLQAGRLDAIFAQRTSLNATLQRQGYTGYMFAGPSFVGDLFGTGFGVGLRKQDTELKTMFDAAINAAIADGTINRLSRKWFKLDMTGL